MRTWAIKSCLPLIAAVLMLVLPQPSPSADANANANDTDAHGLFLGTLWIQTSGEYRALARQTYALAALRLDQALADPLWTAATEQKNNRDLPPAVILDVDETVLDNSPFEGELVRTKSTFNRALWHEWTARAAAEPIPGALEFTLYAKKMGVAVFYVTNRDHEDEEATRQNLARFGFPLDDDTDTLLMKAEQPQWDSSKRSRRAYVAQRYRVLLLVGDDLNDFLPANAIEPEARAHLADANAERWGREWILLPNPLYGSWDRSLYGFDESMTAAQKLDRRRGYLKGFRQPSPLPE